jgi:uncharacterized protein (TIGR02147 family)
LSPGPHGTQEDSASSGPSGSDADRRLLAAELERRVARNPSYSMREFASDTGISPSFMAFALQGKRRLCESRARSVAPRLRLGAAARDLLIASARLGAAKDADAAAVAEQELRRLEGRDKLFEPLAASVFNLISRWHHNAIFSLVACRGFQGTAQWVARRLGIDPIEVDRALARMQRLGLLRQTPEGTLVQGASGFTTGDVPSAAIRDYHSRCSSAPSARSPSSRRASATCRP